MAKAFQEMVFLIILDPHRGKTKMTAQKSRPTEVMGKK